MCLPLIMTAPNDLGRREKGGGSPGWEIPLIGGQIRQEGPCQYECDHTNAPGNRSLFTDGKYCKQGTLRGCECIVSVKEGECTIGYFPLSLSNQSNFPSLHCAIKGR